MSQSLIEALIKNKKISINTIVSLETKCVVNLFHEVKKQENFFISAIGYNRDNVLVFKTRNCNNPMIEKTVKWQDLKEIEGMSLERLAENYELDLQGNPLPTKLDLTGEPLRRGRKKKSYYEKLQQMNLANIQQDDFEEEEEEQVDI
jgi:hypothetical protein